MKVLVLGGAGFIGSNIANQLFLKGHNVTVIDGFFEKTGANINNLINEIEIISKPIEEISNFNSIVNNNEIIIDCMGWTSHIDAFQEPFYDLKLNLKSHIDLIKKLTNKHLVIYIGSIGQFGNLNDAKFYSDSPMNPSDVQGINKTAAEQYFRIFSSKVGYKAVALRVPNTFGPGQKIQGNDIGLVGSFIRDAIQNKKIVVFGSERYRTVLFIKDLVNQIDQIVINQNLFDGFDGINIGGIRMKIHDLAIAIQKILPETSIEFKDLPAEIGQLDFGGKEIDNTTEKSKIGILPRTELSESLINTIKYFYGNNLEM